MRAFGARHLKVAVAAVSHHGRLYVGHGREEATGRRVSFVGDWRELSDIDNALRYGGARNIRVDVPVWACYAFGDDALRLAKVEDFEEVAID